MADPQANAAGGPRTDVVIVGGGLAGLSCALALIEADLGVTVIERDVAAGGRARSWADLRTGDSVDVGPHIFLSEYPNMLRLLDTLGSRQDVVWQSDRLITLLERGRSTVVPHSRWPAPLHLLPGMLQAPTVSLRDKLSNVRVSWFAMRMGDEDVAWLDAMAADEFLRRMGVSERFIAWFWASAAIAIENVPLELCSAGALLRLYRHLIGHRGVRIGFPARGLGELFAPQAVARIEAAGGRVLTRTAVRGFSGEDGAADGVVLADGTRVTARWCVAAVPPQDLGALLPAAWAGAHAAFRVAADFRPSPYVSTYLWFARKLSRERFWARVWSPDDLNTDFYDLSNLRIGWEDRPSLIAANAIYSHRADGLSDEEVIATTLRELADFLPAAARERPLHARVHRVAMAKHASHPGTERKRPPTATPIRGLFLAGDWVHTDLPASMESAVRSGWLAAEAVCAEAGRPRRLALRVRPPDGIAGLVRRFAPLQGAGRTG